MAVTAELAADQLSTFASTEIQRLAARMAQDTFSGIFRLTLSGNVEILKKTLPEAEALCFNWSLAGTSEESRALRLALLVSGIDQWALAYSQAFDLNEIPGVTALLGNLRARLDPKADAQFQLFFSQLDGIETDAADFKVEIRRSIHLALWHAMIASETREESQKILESLGGMMLALDATMPQLGWRLLADALASIQISLLSESLTASALAQEVTQQLFEALRQSVPKERFQTMLAYSGQAVLAWQQSRRPAN